MLPHRILRKTLLNLRLTSKMFATYAPINAALFSTITLRAMKDQEPRFQQLPAAAFCPFVEKVVFVPSPYSIDLSIEGYKDLLLVQRVHNAEPRQTFDSDDVLHHAKFHENYHWNGQFAKSAREIKAGYESYKMFAQEDHEFISEHTLPPLWTTILQGLSALREVVISNLVDCDPHTLDTRDTFDNDCEAVLKYQSRATAQMGDLLLECAIESLVLAAKNIRTLLLESALKTTFTEGWQDHWWQRLDLGKTTCVTIREVPQAYTPTFPDWAHSEETQRQGDAFIGSILTKSHSSLVRLSIGALWIHNHITIESLPALGFPCLRVLSLGSVYIDAVVFERALQHSPALKELELERCGLLSSSRGWRLVFNAIRKHAGINKVDFENCYYEDMDAEWDCIFERLEDTGEIIMRTHYSDRHASHLAKYLCNQGKWTEELSEYFEVD